MSLINLNTNEIFLLEIIYSKSMKILFTLFFIKFGVKIFLFEINNKFC